MATIASAMRFDDLAYRFFNYKFVILFNWICIDWRSRCEHWPSSLGKPPKLGGKKIYRADNDILLVDVLPGTSSLVGCCTSRLSS